MDRMSKVSDKFIALLLGGLLLAACSSKPASESAGESAGEKAAEIAQPAAAEITPDDVEVFDVKLLRGAGGKGYRVEGQVQNNSAKVALGEFEFQLVMQDCLTDGSCNILARDVATIPAKVSPGESTAFQYAPNLSDMPAPQGHLGYHYTIVAARSGSATAGTAKP